VKLNISAICLNKKFLISEVKGSNITKKMPSPLEKSLTYLNAEDDSTSDSESLAR
jgi:hypothetical protein